MKRKTHEEYVAELAIKNPNVKVIGEYNGLKTKITHRCLIHNVDWEAAPTNVLNGNGCRKCLSEKISFANRKPKEQYIRDVKKHNPNVIVIGEYINIATPILHKCLIHNNEWFALPNNILRGCGCPKCKADKLSVFYTKEHQLYVDELKQKNPYITVLEQYINAFTPILHKCLLDGNEWYAKPTNILSGKGCPKCNDSKGERAIRRWLEEHNIEYEPQKKFSDCRDINPLPFDFYLPKHNVAIEYNGKQHYISSDFFGGDKALAYTQRHDKMKEEYCKKNKIRFLCIPYTKNVETELNNFLFI